LAEKISYRLLLNEISEAFQEMMFSIPKVKKQFPFSLGTTSYIIPADIMPNVRALAPCIDDIELVLFQSPDFSNIPSLENIRILRELAQSHQITYTVHLPIDRKAAASDRIERELFCDGVKKIVNQCNALNPAAWILHLEGISEDSTPKEISEWKKRCIETMENIKNVLPHPELIAIENLAYPWEWHQNIATRYNTSLCCDVGHLWINFLDRWQNHLKEMLPRTKVIHLHGTANGKDHISLSEGNPLLIKSFFDIIRKYSYSGIITLEVFNEHDFISSIEVIQRLWEK